jgi:hypothetical protein
MTEDFKNLNLKNMDYNELETVIRAAARELITREASMRKEIIPQARFGMMSFAHGVLHLHYQQEQVTSTRMG